MRLVEQEGKEGVRFEHREQRARWQQAQCKRVQHAIAAMLRLVERCVEEQFRRSADSRRHEFQSGAGADFGACKRLGWGTEGVRQGRCERAEENRHTGDPCMHHRSFRKPVHAGIIEGASKTIQRLHDAGADAGEKRAPCLALHANPGVQAGVDRMALTAWGDASV